MIKRLFDIIISFIFLIILSPLFIIIALWIILDSRGGAFYTQQRVGRGNKDFSMYKFRTMKPDSDSKGLLTVGGRDPRVTRAGYYLRKSKLDELPQIFNVLKGNMSFVGPRPEVRKYVNMYNSKQLKVLNIRPGITDPASLEYIDENILLEKSKDPEKTYIDTIMPAKLDLNLAYMKNHSLKGDIKIIFKTVAGIFRP